MTAGISLIPGKTGALIERRYSSVDAYRPTLDAVSARGSAEHVLTHDQHLPRPGESDAGLTAAKNDFAVRSQHKLFLVCLDGQVPGFGFRGLDRAKNDRQGSIAVFESQDGLLANFFLSEPGKRRRLQRRARCLAG